MRTSLLPDAVSLCGNRLWHKQRQLSPHAASTSNIIVASEICGCKLFSFFLQCIAGYVIMNIQLSIYFNEACLKYDVEEDYAQFPYTNPREWKKLCKLEPICSNHKSVRWGLLTGFRQWVDWDHCLVWYTREDFLLRTTCSSFKSICLKHNNIERILHILYTENCSDGLNDS